MSTDILASTMTPTLAALKAAYLEKEAAEAAAQLERGRKEARAADLNFDDARCAVFDQLPATLTAYVVLPRPDDWDARSQSITAHIEIPDHAAIVCYFSRPWDARRWSMNINYGQSWYVQECELETQFKERFFDEQWVGWMAGLNLRLRGYADMGEALVQAERAATRRIALQAEVDAVNAELAARVDEFAARAQERKAQAAQKALQDAQARTLALLQPEPTAAEILLDALQNFVRETLAQSENA